MYASRSACVAMSMPSGTASRTTGSSPWIVETLAPSYWSGIVNGAEIGDRRFVVADIPGILEGAHEGKGLGLDFLRHIERTRVLLFLIDLTSERPEDDFRKLREELRHHGHGLVDRPYLIVLNKADVFAEALELRVAACADSVVRGAVRCHVEVVRGTVQREGARAEGAKGQILVEITADIDRLNLPVAPGTPPAAIGAAYDAAAVAARDVVGRARREIALVEIGRAHV